MNNTNVSWVREAVEEIKPAPEKVTLRYSGKFKDYNGNVRYNKSELAFSLAKTWKDIDKEIQKGIIQHLTCKVYKISRRTLAIDLYDEFIKQAGKYAKKDPSDPYLEERFHVLNDQYFDGLMEMPALTWGVESFTKLGSYTYATDTVRMSTILRENQDLLDYVLYHELLHKKHQFTCSGTKTMHHTKAFREDEAKFWLEDAEKKLQAFVQTQRRKKKRVKRKKFWFFS